jgi:two-component system, sensor histidine kinase
MTPAVPSMSHVAPLGVARTGRETRMASVRPEALERDPSPRAKGLRSGDRDGWSALLAHDLKTPLAAISMNLDYALSKLPDDTGDQIQAALTDCQEANARAVRLVQDMVDGLRLATGDLKPRLDELPILPVLEQVIVSQAAEAASRAVRILWTSGEEIVRADRGLIVRALDRLVERGIRHAGGRSMAIDQRGGVITIRIETPARSDVDSSDRALATHFAETVVHAQGGQFSIEVDAGWLVYRIRLPTCDR